MYTILAEKSRVKGTAFIKTKLKFETELSGNLHGKINFEQGLKKRAQGNLGEYSRKKYAFCKCPSAKECLPSSKE